MRSVARESVWCYEMNGDQLLAAHAHRHVVFDGARNFRDLGGLATRDGGITRHGVIYRSDSWSELSARDLARVEALNVRTVVDFRTEDERARAPDRLPEAAALAVHARGFYPRGNYEMIAGINAGVLDSPTAHANMLDQYRRLALDHCAIYRELIEILLTPQTTPLVFHCASGKDRTGVAAAVVLLAVGVAPSLVLEDYVISNYQRRAVSLFGAAPQNPAVEQVMSAVREYLEHALQAMQQAYGSVDGYLTDAIGLDRATQARLKTLLVA